jgi:hypothetical protein
MWSASSAHAGGGCTAPARTLRVVVLPILLYFKFYFIYLFIIYYFLNCRVILHLKAAKDSHVGISQLYINVNLNYVMPTCFLYGAKMQILHNWVLGFFFICTTMKVKLLYIRKCGCSSLVQ